VQVGATGAIRRHAIREHIRLDPDEYAAHGGAFPSTVSGAGVAAPPDHDVVARASQCQHVELLAVQPSGSPHEIARTAI
jgi:uncharacterized protein (UPF0303 family)